jgi:Ca2+-transporting ATPase
MCGCRFSTCSSEILFYPEFSLSFLPIIHHSLFRHSQALYLNFRYTFRLLTFHLNSNRQLENTFNLAEGVLQNWLFIAISSIMIGAQVLIVFVGGQAFSVVELSGVQWAYSIVLGFLSIPVGYLIRQIPDAPIERLIEDGQGLMSKLMRFRNRS